VGWGLAVATEPSNQPDAKLVKVLVVDDEPNIADLLVTGLRFVGFDVKSANGGRKALESVADWHPDLVILDVMMPGMDGFEVVRRLRDEGRYVPVIFLTARDGTQDKVRGLTAGADDYVTKPFSLEEVVARVRTVLRRSGLEATAAEAQTLRYADLELDEDIHEVRRAGRPVDLSPTEFAVLRYLMLNAGRVVSKTQIVDHVWRYDFGGESSIVENYISYLRKKLDPLGPPLIHTLRGVGYSLRLPREPADG
jgi:two-component system OmpR family response regulator